MVGKRANELTDAVTALGHQRGLDVEQVAFANLLRHQAVQVGEMRAHEQADNGHDQRNDRQRADVAGPLRAVKAADGLTQRVDAVGEREHRVDRAEEGVGHLDGIQARAAGDLHEHQDDAHADADMLKRRGKRVRDAQIRQRQQDGRRVERRDRSRLNAQVQATGHAHHGLQHHQDGEEHPTPQITLHDGEAGNSLLVHLELQDDAQHDGAHPQAQGDEQRRHGRAVGVERIELLGGHLRGRLHELGDLLGVDATGIDQVGNGRRGTESRDVDLRGGDGILQLRKHAVGLPERRGRRVERGVELVDDVGGLGNERTLVGDGGLQTDRRAAHLGNAIADLGKRRAEQLRLIRAGRGKGGLDRRVDGAGRTGSRLRRAIDVAGELLQVVEVSLSLVRAGVERIDGSLQQRFRRFAVGQAVVDGLQLLGDGLAGIDDALRTLHRGVDRALRLADGVGDVRRRGCRGSRRVGKPERGVGKRRHGDAGEVHDARLQRTGQVGNLLQLVLYRGRVASRLVELAFRRLSLGTRLRGGIRQVGDRRTRGDDGVLRAAELGRRVGLRSVQVAFSLGNLHVQGVGDHRTDGRDELTVDGFVERG